VARCFQPVAAVNRGVGPYSGRISKSGAIFYSTTQKALRFELIWPEHDSTERSPKSSQCADYRTHGLEAPCHKNAKHLSCTELSCSKPLHSVIGKHARFARPPPVFPVPSRVQCRQASLD
jgi:hypothetical protein